MTNNNSTMSIDFRNGNKWGFCNELKNIIIEPIYESAKTLSNYLEAANRSATLSQFTIFQNAAK